MQLPTCTTPIHWQKNAGKLESEGTGTLIEVAKQYHILTSAAHVLLHDPLWLPGKPKFIPLEAAGRVFTTSENRDAAKIDDRDVGFCILTESAVGALTNQGIDFLSYRQTAFGKDLPAPTRLICSGYPVSKSRDHVRLQITNTRMDIDELAFSPEELTALEHDPRIHVAMHYDRFNVEHEGQHITGSIPKGMSGGPIWQLIDGLPVLIAIFTDYDANNKILRGTRIVPLLAEVRRRILASPDEPH